MKCIVERFGDDRNGRKMIAWGRRSGCADAGHVFAAERRPRFHSPRRFAILVSAMLRQSFTDFIFATNTDGSGKAASYVRALDMLGPILAKHYPKPIVGGSMRHSFSLADIHAFSRSGTRPSSRRRKHPHWRFAGLFMGVPHWVNYDKMHKKDCDRF